MGVVYSKMGRTSATILLMWGLVFVRAYPGGSPSCTSRPGHGRSNGMAYGEVTNIGGNNWQVTVFDQHKGLVINTRSRGTWDYAGAGYKNQGTCVTHNSRSGKGMTSFIFRAREEGTPRFSGFIVYNYNSYSSILF